MASSRTNLAAELNCVEPVESGVLVRIKGQPPLAAAVYELEKLRCALCGNVYTAAAPPQAGEKKYDETGRTSVRRILAYFPQK